MASSWEYIVKAPCPTSNTKSPLPLSKISSLHLFQLLTIDIDTRQHPEMWYHEVSLTARTTKSKKKLNVVLSCAYLSEVVLWGNICWQGLWSPCLGPPIQQHLLGKSRLKVTQLEMFSWPIAQRWQLRYRQRRQGRGSASAMGSGHDQGLATSPMWGHQLHDVRYS